MLVLVAASAASAASAVSAPYTQYRRGHRESLDIQRIIQTNAAALVTRSKQTPQQQGARSSDPPYPSLPGKWYTMCNYTQSLNGSAVGSFTGDAVTEIASDSSLQHSFMNQGNKLPFAPLEFVGSPLEWINISTWSTQNDSFTQVSGAYYHSDPASPYNDLFSWVAIAKYDGDNVVDGTTLHRWVLNQTSPYVMSLLLRVTDDNTPFDFKQEILYPYPDPSSLTHVVQNYTFLTFVPDGEMKGYDPWADFNVERYIDPPPCPAETIPPPTTMVSYIFHPKSSFNITGQDNGDELGDVFFVCEDLITNQSAAMGEGYEWITAWEIEYIPRFGQYQNCNGYPSQCLGNEHFWVGHEAGLGLGEPAGGQCVDNPKVGEWYSLPYGGQCPPGVTPDGSRCTWAAKRIKTLDSHCLFKHGYRAACLADGRAPFASAQKLFSAAFASEDTSQNGCPALPGPPTPPY